MKRRLLYIGVVIILAVGMISCDEEANPPMVWGSVSALGTKDASGKNGPVILNGLTLGEKGGYLVGYCKYKDEKFSFGFGTASPSNISSSSDYYFSIDGIKGPPAAAPYDADGLPRTDETRTFTNGEMHTSAGAWVFDQSDMIDDRCLVVVFAEGSTGNLTPLDYGKAQFDYLVNIDCEYGLDNVPSQYAPDDRGSELDGFVMTLWFKDCEV